jgi:hypothetical protein
MTKASRSAGAQCPPSRPQDGWRRPARSRGLQRRDSMIIAVGVMDSAMASPTRSAGNRSQPATRPAPTDRCCRRARSRQGAAWKRRSVTVGAERRPTLTAPCARRLARSAVGTEESLRRGRTKERDSKGKERESSAQCGADARAKECSFSAYAQLIGADVLRRSIGNGGHDRWARACDVQKGGSLSNGFLPNRLLSNSSS